mmetsp:Transcript_65816/g.152932  ORF Transcript_65816/g.152932 Transcript_65816/m.152932 type:complete len:278 (+) Transcript_65816:226-1059(+)
MPGTDSTKVAWHRCQLWYCRRQRRVFTAHERAQKTQSQAMARVWIAAVSGEANRASRRQRLVPSPKSSSTHHQRLPWKSAWGLGREAARCNSLKATKSSTNASHKLLNTALTTSTAMSIADHQACPSCQGTRRTNDHSSKPSARKQPWATKSTPTGVKVQQPKLSIIATSATTTCARPSSGFTMRLRCRNATRPSSNSASAGMQVRKLMKRTTSRKQTEIWQRTRNCTTGTRAAATARAKQPGGSSWRQDCRPSNNATASTSAMVRAKRQRSAVKKG